MDEQQFHSRMHGIHDDILRLQSTSFALEASNFRQYPENFLELNLDIAARAEKLACKFRHLVGDYGVVRKELLMDRVVEVHDIVVVQENGMVSIKMPRLLPKHRKARSSEFINQPLFYALDRYCQTNRVLKSHECAVCFVHVYDETLSLGRIRDYDNLETRSVLNTIAAFFMTDDSGALCDAYHTTALGPDDCTHVYILPQDRLPGFIAKLKNDPNSMSNFEAFS